MQEPLQCDIFSIVYSYGILVGGHNFSIRNTKESRKKAPTSGPERRVMRLAFLFCQSTSFSEVIAERNFAELLDH